MKDELTVMLREAKELRSATLKLRSDTLKLREELINETKLAQLHARQVADRIEQRLELSDKFMIEMSRRLALKEKPNEQQYKANIDTIARLVLDGGVVSYSIKTHGTSGRTTKIRLPMKPNKLLWKLSNVFGDAGLWKIAAYIQRKLEEHVEGKFDKDYTILTGSRNVIMHENVNNFRTNISSWFSDRLKNDEAIYYEILGWENENTPIMEMYKNIPYNYGLDKGTYGIQVYRITQNGIDLSVMDMESRTYELGLVPVHRIYKKTAQEAFDYSLSANAAIVAIGKESVSCNKYTHTNEGVVIRVDMPNQPTPHLFKWKGLEFLMQEGIIPQQGDVQ